MIKYQPFPTNYPFELSLRTNELNLSEKDKIIFALNIHADFLNCSFDESEALYEIVHHQNNTFTQPGFSPLVFPYLKSLVERQLLTKNIQRLNLLDFLNSKHIFYPMNLKRESHLTLNDINDELYISCIYVLNHQRELIVSPFSSHIISQVWYDRSTHADLLDSGKSLVAGVMYFSKKDKKLLFINNASGHYRIELEHSMPIMLTVLEKVLDISDTKVSHWSDNEFYNTHYITKYRKILL